MTRQIFILILSIGAVILGGICESKYIERSSNFVLADINYIENALNNNNIEMAKKHSKELENSWKNVKDSWNIFIQNDLTDQIDDSLVELKAYIKLGNKEEALVYTHKLKENIISIVDRQRLNMENIF